MSRRSLLNLLLVIGLVVVGSCYTPHPIKRLPTTETLSPRTLFLALDGIDHTLMAELRREGYFKDFGASYPLISTFPSATTIGFTGIFQPLNVGTVPGYEVRFFSKNENRIIGGTPKDIYKIPINYKYYFDVFRHKMTEKSLMYAFPGIAGRQDKEHIKDALFNNPKRVLFTYIGATDGSAHLLGRRRTKRYLIELSKFLADLKMRYERERGEPLKIVMFSDHGFEYTRLKTVNAGQMKQALQDKGYQFNAKLEKPGDVVAVRFGLISAAAFFTAEKNQAEVGRVLATIKGVDLSFWPEGKSRIHVRNSEGAEAYFEYAGSVRYRYVSIKGQDPLNYLPILKGAGYADGRWLADKEWQRLFFDHAYPDAGYRLHDAFFHLVENRASVMISLKPDYQYGSTAALIGVSLEMGQNGTHGSLLRQSSWAFAMATGESQSPKFLRYDDLFVHYLPQVVQALRGKTRGIH